MDKFKKSQILKLLFVAILLSITPLLSTSLRPPYLYFVVNLLIIALGAEAGLLSFISKAAEDKKAAGATVAQKPLMITPADSPMKEESPNTTNAVLEPEPTKKKPKVVEKSTSEKIVSDVKVHKTVKKCPSTPSLFFIGGGETEAEEFVEDDNQEDVGELSGQELFYKAETFIGNFYNQLKMQREDSQRKIHGLYQKAF